MKIDVGPFDLPIIEIAEPIKYFFIINSMIPNAANTNIDPLISFFILTCPFKYTFFIITNKLESAND